MSSVIVLKFVDNHRMTICILRAWNGNDRVVTVERMARVLVTRSTGVSSGFIRTACAAWWDLKPLEAMNLNLDLGGGEGRFYKASRA